MRRARPDRSPGEASSGSGRDPAPGPPGGRCPHAPTAHRAAVVLFTGSHSSDDPDVVHPTTRCTSSGPLVGDGRTPRSRRPERPVTMTYIDRTDLGAST